MNYAQWNVSLLEITYSIVDKTDTFCKSKMYLAGS